MSQLELLKTHIENMNKRIKTIETEINEKKQVIINYENQRIEIETILNRENELYAKLVENHAYLCDVKQNTSSNYTQLEEAATTLLDILKNKCDGI